MRISQTSCACCGHAIDATTRAMGQQAPPSPGDVSFCVYCGGWSMFDEELGLRLPTEEESQWIAEDMECILIADTWQGRSN